MHHYEHVAPNVDVILQSGRFSATSIALFRERFSDSRSCWVVFIHVVWGRPGGLLQFSKWEAVKMCPASDSSGICSVAGQGETPCLNSSRKMWLLCFPSHIVIPYMVVPFDSQQFTQTSYTVGLCRSAGCPPKTLLCYVSQRFV